ncbi:hypothetical protein FKM82_025576 [Ascaphus truei]
MSPKLEFTPFTSFEALCRRGSYQKGLITRIKASFEALVNSHDHDCMLKWAADLKIEIDRDDWEDIWEFAAKTSICTATKENIYKILFIGTSRHGG